MQQKVTKYTESEQAQVEERLEAILSSPGFENSVQMSNFLRFIVEKTLQGKTQDLKGYTIGVDALGRPEDFDPQTDPSVRVMAGRLRQALDNFNRDSPGPVSIILEKGNYVPSFGFLGVSEDELQTMEAEDIAAAIRYAVTAPQHVNVSLIELQPTEQSFGATQFDPLDWKE